MVSDAFEKHLKGRSVVQILTGVDLEAQIDPDVIESVKDWLPSLCKFIECSFDQARRTLRPRVYVGPSQCSGKSHMSVEAQVGRGFRRKAQLVDCPCLTSGGFSPKRLWSEAVERLIVRGMNSDELSLQMRRKLRYT